MALKKPLHVEVLVESAMLADLLELLEGKAEILNIGRVKHGGIDQETGALRSRQTAREFLMNYAKAHPQFLVREINEKAAEVGITKGSIYQAITKGMKEGVMQRVAPKTYALTGAAKARVFVAGGAADGHRVEQVRQQFAHLKKTKSAGPVKGTVPQAILDYVRSKQNGTGEGVSKKDINIALKEANLGTKNAARALDKLVAAKHLKRVGANQYRVEA